MKGVLKMNTWSNGYSNDFVDSRLYKVSWYNEEFEDIELVTAFDESEAEQLAEKLIPEDAVITAITAVRVA